MHNSLPIGGIIKMEDPDVRLVKHVHVNRYAPVAALELSRILLRAVRLCTTDERYQRQFQFVTRYQNGKPDPAAVK
jgi:hypothetical protein